LKQRNFELTENLWPLKNKCKTVSVTDFLGIFICRRPLWTGRRRFLLFLLAFWCFVSCTAIAVHITCSVVSARLERLSSYTQTCDATTVFSNWMQQKSNFWVQSVGLLFIVISFISILQ